MSGDALLSGMFFELCSRIGQSLDFADVERLGNRIGRAIWALQPGRRRIAVEAVAEHLAVGKRQARDIAHQSFMHNGRSFLEIFLTRRAGPRFIEEMVDIPEASARNIQVMREADRPVVIATGHLGAWEVLIGMLQMFPGRPRQVVVRRLRSPGMNKIILHMRGQAGVEIVEHRQATFKVMKALRQNGIVAFLVDHNCSQDEAIFLPFLGETAAVNIGPALLAVRSKAMIMPGCLLRGTGGKYVFHLDDPLRTDELQGDRQDKIEAAARYYTQAMEKYVRLAPEQWFWMHKRWKTRPPGESSAGRGDVQSKDCHGREDDNVREAGSEN